MRETSDTNELHPLTEAANNALQDYTKQIKEFATSSSWGTSAVALHLSEGPEGYDVTMGFELRTPLDFPLQDIVKAHGTSREQATLRAVAEWLQLFFKPAMLIHFDKKSERIREGQTTIGNKTTPWRMAEGSLMVGSEHLTDMGQLKAELAERPLFDRVEMGDVFRFPHDVPLLCVKMQLWRPAGEKMKTVYECKLNNEQWEEGLERLQRFELAAGVTSMMVRQYLIVKPVEKKVEAALPKGPGETKMGVVKPLPVGKAAAPAVAGGTSAAARAGAAAGTGRKSWWKFW